MNYSFTSANNRYLSQPAIADFTCASLVNETAFGTPNRKSLRNNQTANIGSPRNGRLTGKSLEILDTQRAI
jgi:hypothetical protein